MAKEKKGLYQTAAVSLVWEELKKYLAPRKRDANKSNFGHVLIVGGDYGMPGAVRMAGEATYRVGAGLVTIATHPEHVNIVTAACPELMCYGVQTSKELMRLINRANVIVLGPGLGQSVWSKKLFKTVLSSNKPKVIDADGLNLLAKSAVKLADTVLTPHVGEASRLLKCSLEEIHKDRLIAVQRLQEKFKAVCVLKGAGSLIKGSTGNVYRCDAGNPGMASGGMGDVLSGVIAGLIAQGLSLENAACLGVYLHALAGDEAAKEGGERGLLAMDLLPYLRKFVNA